MPPSAGTDEAGGERTRVRASVTFSDAQVAYFADAASPAAERSYYYDGPASRWLSESDLAPCRREARTAVELLSRRTTCPPSAHSFLLPDGVCLRGIEKYADAAGKAAGQKRLVAAVIDEHRRDGSTIESVAAVSRYLSGPFRDLAEHFAKCSRLEVLREQREQDEMMIEERRRRQEVQESASKAATPPPVPPSSPSSASTEGHRPQHASADGMLRMLAGVAIASPVASDGEEDEEDASVLSDGGYLSDTTEMSVGGFGVSFGKIKKRRPPVSGGGENVEELCKKRRTAVFGSTKQRSE